MSREVKKSLLPEKRLILASASPRRKMLLKQAGFVFKVCVSSYDEGRPQGGAKSFVLKSAQGKANAVIEQDLFKTGWVLAADTIVVCGRSMLGKPKTQKEAEQMIRMLSGKNHKVLTGVVLKQISGIQKVEWVEETSVSMRSLLDHELENYLESMAWQGKAGAYGIQDKAGAFVTRVEGCYFNVVGLPLGRVSLELLKRGIG